MLQAGYFHYFMRSTNCECYFWVVSNFGAEGNKLKRAWVLRNQVFGSTFGQDDQTPQFQQSTSSSKSTHKNLLGHAQTSLA
mmetsp:Transcript_27777/g.57951  ORF Transcript_27777/g.57951 Transcript_27777/m.57951 type:complete len:81 (+) Transcript_27777:30-272(+)